jgi:DNA-binding MarR family transcriptional regulator
MEQYSGSTAQMLGRSLMELNKEFWQYNRERLQYVLVGCNPSESRILFMIREATKTLGREPKVSEISKMMHVTSPTVTQLIKSLEASGLVERHIDLTDRRAVGIVLTERGERVVEKAEEIFTTTFQGLIEYLGEDQSNQLVELLVKAKSYFDDKGTRMSYSQWNGAEKA